MISVSKAKEMPVAIQELLESAVVLSTEVDRLQEIIKEAIATVECFEQAEDAQELHDLLETSLDILYKSGLAATDPEKEAV